MKTRTLQNKNFTQTEMISSNIMHYSVSGLGYVLCPSLMQKISYTVDVGVSYFKLI